MTKTNQLTVGFIFDLDGTILDDIDIVREMPYFLAEQYQIKLTEPQVAEMKKQIFKDLSGTGSRFLMIKSILLTAKLMGIPWYKRWGFLMKAKKFYKQRIKDVPLIPNILQTIDQLRENFGPVGINTTSSWKEVEDRFTNRMFLLERFNGDIITRDKVKNSKPHPESIYKLSKHWQIPSENLVMIGDMDTDIETAHRAGSISVGVLTGFATVSDFERAGADFILDNASEILGILPEIRNKIKNN